MDKYLHPTVYINVIILICALISMFIQLISCSKRYQWFEVSFRNQITLSKMVAEISGDISAINSSLPGQNGGHFSNDIFKCIFVNKKFYILIWIPLKFVPKVPIGNKSTLVQVMAWRQIDDKPLPEPVLTQFTDVCICGTPGRWVKRLSCNIFIRLCL